MYSGAVVAGFLGRSNFLEARVTAAGNAVTLECLGVPLHQARWGGWSPAVGEAAVLALRPNKIMVLGAGEEWLPVYRESGMHDLYVGDEAVIDCGRFTLEGGRYKGLRQAVNRMAKYGYTVTFHDPEEQLLLPSTIQSTVVTRGAMQRTRRTQTFTNYRRFITGGRLVKDPGAR